MAEQSIFGDAADAVRAMAPSGLGQLYAVHHRYGMKVWFDDTKPPREHYEAQVIGRQYAPGATVLAVEIGFHSEHPKESDNEAVISDLLRSERTWRRELGHEAVAGPFLGRAEHWRRVSEVWPDPDLSDPETAFELAARLTDYVTALEPRRRPAKRG